MPFDSSAMPANRKSENAAEWIVADRDMARVSQKRLNFPEIGMGKSRAKGGRKERLYANSTNSLRRGATIPTGSR
jgi:hypothetical protein